MFGRARASVRRLTRRAGVRRKRVCASGGHFRHERRRAFTLPLAGRAIAYDGMAQSRRASLAISYSVMPGLDPGIHVFLSGLRKEVDGRDKPGHDDVETDARKTWMAICDSLALAGRVDRREATVGVGVPRVILHRSAFHADAGSLSRGASRPSCASGPPSNQVEGAG